MKYIAKILIYDLNGKILVLQRSNTHPRFALHDDLPGGEIEAGEPVTIGAAREITEETGIRIAPANLQLLLEQTRPSGNQFLLYSTQLDSVAPAIQISWEHVGYAWHLPAALATKNQPEDADSLFIETQQYLTGLTAI